MIALIGAAALLLGALLALAGAIYTARRNSATTLVTTTLGLDSQERINFYQTLYDQWKQLNAEVALLSGKVEQADLRAIGAETRAVAAEARTVAAEARATAAEARVVAQRKSFTAWVQRLLAALEHAGWKLPDDIGPPPLEG